ncbi:MAG: elongation factor Ts [Candidatus Omnitrophota bacterium]|nr:MAG: elongation factor Ts [Candidatus Omnitrophota bacterium]
MSLDDIKRLRELTSLGIGDCKDALKEAGGDFDKALKILKNKGIQLTKKKQSRTASQGRIEAYVHFGGNLGALVEVNCETDFVARTEVFKNFVKDLAMQVAATAPKYITRQDIPQSELKEVENPDEYVKESCLLEQPFIKDNKIAVEDYLRDVVSQTGENVIVKRFVRFSLGG